MPTIWEPEPQSRPTASCPNLCVDELEQKQVTSLVVSRAQPEEDPAVVLFTRHSGSANRIIQAQEFISLRGSQRVGGPGNSAVNARTAGGKESDVFIYLGFIDGLLPPQKKKFCGRLNKKLKSMKNRKIKHKIGVRGL